MRTSGPITALAPIDRAAPDLGARPDDGAWIDRHVRPRAARPGAPMLPARCRSPRTWTRAAAPRDKASPPPRRTLDTAPRSPARPYLAAPARHGGAIRGTQPRASPRARPHIWDCRERRDRRVPAWSSGATVLMTRVRSTSALACAPVQATTSARVGWQAGLKKIGLAHGKPTCALSGQACRPSAPACKGLWLGRSSGSVRAKGSEARSAREPERLGIVVLVLRQHERIVEADRPERRCPQQAGAHRRADRRSSPGRSRRCPA